ncbi:MAG: DUF5719 family protein [Actinomycetota bacterium]
MRRIQALAAAILVALGIGGAVYADRELGPRSLSAGTAATAPSGEWFCPHGGGKTDWEVELQVANPGIEAATIRILTIGRGRAEPGGTFKVEPGSLLRLPVPAEGRERASTVEWFDQWVAVGWVAHAGGDEGGLAAEPCAANAGGRWLLPDGTTATDDDDDYVVVMNPFSRDAVFSVTLLSERTAPVQHGDLTDVVLHPHHSVAVRLSDWIKNERTVSALVDASIGRVAAGTLGISRAGGVRSTTGYLGDPPGTLIFPGGRDAGRTDLAVMSAALERVGLTGELLDEEAEQPFGGLADTAPPAQSGRTYTASTAGPTSVVFAADAPGVAVARRTYGVASDQGSTNGAAPARAWVVLPAVLGFPSHPGLAFTNPGTEPVELTLSYLWPGPDEADPITLTIPPHRTATAPQAFLEAAPDGAVLAVASGGTFVPAAASYSRGREGFATYAVALGIEIPAAWIPA